MCGLVVMSVMLICMHLKSIIMLKVKAKTSKYYIYVIKNVWGNTYNR
jgi:hypothetical protein